MVEIEDIIDRDSLYAWLESQPRQYSEIVAHRAVMRALPIYLEWVFTPEFADKLDFSAIPVLRACLISGVIAYCPLPDVKLNLRKAAELAFLAGMNVEMDYLVNLPQAAQALRNAHRASATDVVVAAYAAAATARNISDGDPEIFLYAAKAALRENNYEEIRADCQILAQGASLEYTRLWQNQQAGDTPLKEIWENAKSAMAIDGRVWSFWIRWYEASLAGKPVKWEMLEQIALAEYESWERVDPEDLSQGPVHVSELIARIEEEFKGAEPEAQVTPSQMLNRNRSTIEAQLDTLAKLVTEEMTRIRGKNDFGEAEGALIAARVSVLESIIEAVEKIRAALQGEAPSIALTVVEEQLPEILKGGEALVKSEDQPSISVSVAQMGETISFLTQKGTPGTLATGIAAAEWTISQPVKWWNYWKKQ